ncbi:MAG: SPOR domain-containing protein [Mangrovibacterium sp.]
MKKSLASLFLLAVALVSCNDKKQPKVVEKTIIPVETVVDTIAADTTSFEYNYEVHEDETNTSNTYSSDLNENDKYFVVVGSFETTKRANKHIAYLQTKGINAMIVQRHRGLNMENYRVAVKSSNNKKEALEAANDLLNDFPDVWVLIK